MIKLDAVVLPETIDAVEMMSDTLLVSAHLFNQRVRDHQVKDYENEYEMLLCAMSGLFYALTKDPDPLMSNPYQRKGECQDEAIQSNCRSES